MHPLVRSLSRSNGGMKSGHRKERGRGKEKERERTSRDTGLESIPVSIARIERSQERARDPPEDDQYELCELLHPAGTTCRPCSTVCTHILCLPTTPTANDRRPSSHVCVDCCAHVRLFYLPTSPALPLPISSFRSRYR